jgi:hypothetical protein
MKQIEATAKQMREVITSGEEFAFIFMSFSDSLCI